MELRHVSFPINELLGWLCANTDNLFRVPSAAIVVAHPDDEVIGAGALLSRLGELNLMHTTDGAPRNMHDALATGFTRREDYARARRNELYAALDLIGIKPEQTHELGIVDQEASFSLVDLARVMSDVLRDIKPDVVITHSYEGGHPDHDATAFAIHAACLLLQKNNIRVPKVVELTSYYNRNGNMAVFEFLPNGGCETATLILSEGERTLKQQMFNCFITQREVLRAFPVKVERFRMAPRYDFTKPPHEGRQFYEYFDWGITGERWRTLAGDALNVLGIGDLL